MLIESLNQLKKCEVKKYDTISKDFDTLKHIVDKWDDRNIMPKNLVKPRFFPDCTKKSHLLLKIEERLDIEKRIEMA